MQRKPAYNEGLKQGEWNSMVKMILKAQRLELPMQTIVELTGFDEDIIVSVLKGIYKE